MYSEEETELRDLIIQNLENCGFLNKIKAELRAGVFLALEEDGNLRNKIPLFNKKLDNFVANNEGKLVLSLVREFLEYFNLHFTLSVFDPEVALSSPCISRSELCEQLKLNSEIDGPVISALMKDEIGEVVNKSSVSKSTEAVTSKSLNLAFIESTSNSNIHSLSNENDNLKKSQIHTSLEKEQHIGNISENKEKETINSMSILSNPNSDVVNNTGIEKFESQSSKASKDLLKESKEVLSTDHDPFFDEPLPNEKPSFFSFTETFKDKSENKLASGIKNLDESKKTSLSSLKDLPSLTGSNEWTFSRDLKSTLPSLDSQKSISSSEASNEEIINIEDPKDGFQKKDSDNAESNESSEKQISEESIEEDIEEDFSAGLDDLLNSSLSLGDDITTDQTVSQVSVVEGVDHVEPCK